MMFMKFSLTNHTGYSMPDGRKTVERWILMLVAVKLSQHHLSLRMADLLRILWFYLRLLPTRTIKKVLQLPAEIMELK